MGQHKDNLIKLLKMAFVYTSERKLVASDNNQEYPSPAHYTIKEQ